MRVHCHLEGVAVGRLGREGVLDLLQAADVGRQRGDLIREGAVDERAPGCQFNWVFRLPNSNTVFPNRLWVEIPSLFLQDLRQAVCLFGKIWTRKENKHRQIASLEETRGDGPHNLRERLLCSPKAQMVFTECLIVGNPNRAVMIQYIC